MDLKFRVLTESSGHGEMARGIQSLGKLRFKCQARKYWIAYCDKTSWSGKSFVHSNCLGQVGQAEDPECGSTRATQRPGPQASVTAATMAAKGNGGESLQILVTGLLPSHYLRS